MLVPRGTFLQKNETDPVVQGSTEGLEEGLIKFWFADGKQMVVKTSDLAHRGVLWLMNGRHVRVGGTPIGANGKTVGEICRDANFAVFNPYCFERKGQYYQRTPGGGFVYNHDEDKHEFYDAVDIDFARVWSSASEAKRLQDEAQKQATAFYMGRTVEILSDWNGAAICSKAKSLRGKTFVVEWVIVAPHQECPITLGCDRWRGGIPANEVKPLKKEGE